MDPSNPFAWPSTWESPQLLDQLLDAADRPFIGCLIAGSAAIREAAAKCGLKTCSRDAPPAGIRIVEGVWPGIQASHSGGDVASAGPTGVPWVANNGWRVSLEAALHPGSTIWIDAPPAANAVLRASDLRLAIADSAAYRGRWILALPDSLAKSIAAGNGEALAVWRSTLDAVHFFAKLPDFPVAHGNIGIVSSFAGPGADFTGEVLNLIGRAGGQYAAIPSQSKESLNGLRAIVYADPEPPSLPLRMRILERVRAGAVLITTPVWGDKAPGAGNIHITAERPEDPYEFANLVMTTASRRSDLVRLWNAGSYGTRCAWSSDRRRLLTHLLFYGGEPHTEVTAWAAGRFRSARLHTFDNKTGSGPLNLVPAAGGAEVRLPPVQQYAAIEWEVSA